MSIGDENVAKALDRLTANIYDTDCTAYRDMQTIRARLVELEAENAAMRECATYYLGLLLHNTDPAEALKQDMRDPEIAGTAHLSENGHEA